MIDTTGSTLESREALLEEAKEMGYIDTHTHGGAGYVGPPAEYVGNVVEAYLAAKEAFGKVYMYFDESVYFGPADVDGLARHPDSIESQYMALTVWWDQYGWAAPDPEWENVRIAIGEAVGMDYRYLRPIEV